MNSTKKNLPGTKIIPQPFNRLTGHAPQIRPVVAQLKTVTSPRPVAPPVYRPQPTPKVLQCKRASHAPLPVNQKWTNTQTIQRAATVVGAEDKKVEVEAKPDPAAAAAAALALKEQRKAAREAEKKARAVIREQEAKVAAANLAEKTTFYRMNAQQAHLYIQGRSVAQIGELKLTPRLFRTYNCAGGVGGEYMFNDIGHGMSAILAQTVIHVHWDAAYNRQYGHFKNHYDKTQGGGSLGAIEAAKLTAMNIRAQETAARVQAVKED